jgi:hypothetical protein
MLNADKGFSNASSGSSTQKNLGIVLGAQSDLATNWKVNTSLAYRDIQYEGVAAAGRVDDYLEASLGATYIVNSNISLNGTYTYRNLYSNVPNVEFGNSVIAVSVSARY